MSKVTSLLIDILLISVILVVVAIFYPVILTAIRSGFGVLSQAYNNATNSNPLSNTAINPNSFQTNQSLSNQHYTGSELMNYTLSLINRDRSSFGLGQVSLSGEQSGQQHADSMLQYDYFSHWDVYGLKPYMRFTELGGQGAVSENIAYIKFERQACIASICHSYGSIDVTNSIQQMEYNMIYNDSACCNNGHRDNILDPNHNQVSIGIAYNSTTVYLVEDFINNYVTWLNGTPGFNASEVFLKAAINPQYNLLNIEVSYDPTLSQMTQSQLDNTSEYGYGTTIAGIAANKFAYYPGIDTIVADAYYYKNNDLETEFNIANLTRTNGPGEYTVMLWLTPANTNQSFVGATYTFFINSNGQAYVLSQV